MIGRQGKHSPTMCCTMPPVYGKQGNTGSSNGVGSWWILLVCPQSSSPTVQLTSSGQNLPALFVVTILTPAQLTTKLSKRTLPSQTGFSTNASSNSLMPSMLESLVPGTTSSASSGSIAAALTFMVLPGFLMLQMWRKCCPIQMSSLQQQGKPFFNISTKL